MNLKIVASIFIVLLVLIAGIAMYFGNKPSPAPATTAPATAPQQNPPVAATIATTTTTGGGGGDASLSDLDKAPRMEPQDVVLTEFTFENLTLPSYVPDASTRLVRIPAGNPPYKLVNCNIANAYAIRWNGRFLNMHSPNKFEWGLEKQEPHGCYTIVPGYCGGNGREFVMLRSAANRHFLRVDEASGMLVCKDTPTARTAQKYCWKLRSNEPEKVPCGPQYSEELKQMIDIPCTIIKDPPKGKGCSSVTKGFIAKCCGKYPDDPDCRGSFWREVVGRPLNEALLYLKTRRPDLTLQPCPSPCNKEPFPIYKANVVMIPYDVRSGYVTSPAFRYI